MYLTPELRSAIYAIPPALLESAANHPNNSSSLPPDPPTAATVTPTVAVEPSRPAAEPPVAASAPTKSVRPAPLTPNYELDSFVAMGFELDMIQRVAALYPRDADACLECLLGGGLPADDGAAHDDMPALVPASKVADFSLADYEDVGAGGGGQKRRRYDPSVDQSTVTSRALVVVDPPPTSPVDQSKPVAAATAGASAPPAVAAAPRRATAADVLFELQSLFATLQMSHSEAISTRSLTDAFGWRASQGVQQQDVHELNRMLFDVIERALKRTPQSKLVQQLYGGATTTALRCEVCGTERRRADGLLDLPLSLRDAQTVHAALAMACGSERLTESNRLTCDVCNARQDTTRSVRLGRFAGTPLSSHQVPASDNDGDAAAAATSAADAAESAPPPSDAVVDVPPLLWLPLARFDYDLQRGQRVKLTQAFLFPLELDLAPYVVGSTASANAALENYVSTTPGKATMLERLAYLTRRCDAPSPYRYVLAAVVLHSGGPFGGHYHALARAPDGAAANVWHDFNDSRVTPLGRTDPLLSEVYFAWRAAEPTPESPEVDSLPDELVGTHRALQKLADAVEGTESAYMLLYRREPLGAPLGGELSAPVLRHADAPPTVLQRRIEEANAVHERERVMRAMQRNRMELDVAVPQWLRVLDDGSVVMAETNTAPIGDAIGEPLSDDPATHDVAHMHIQRLAVDAHTGRATRLRVSLDRRAPLAQLAERLLALMCEPPSSAETGSSWTLAPLRFRGDAAVIAERPTVALTGAAPGATLLSCGISGRSVRMLLWNGTLLRESFAYSGPAINVELMWFGAAAHTQTDPADGLPLRTTTALVLRETATLTSALTVALHRCDGAVASDGDRFLLSALNSQRATPLIEATLCARSVEGSVDGWCQLKPDVALARTLLDTDIGDGAQLALELVPPGAAQNRATAAERFAIARRSKVRLFVVDGRDGRVDGAVLSVYCSRADAVVVAKRRAVEALLAADGAAPASEERVVDLLKRARLRRIGSAIGAVAMGDLAALMWLREEARPLTHYAVEDSTRLLLEDVTWLDDAHSGAQMSEVALIEATEVASSDVAGISLSLRVSPRLRERLAAQTPPLDVDSLLRERLVVPRNCEVNTLMQKVARRFGNMPVKGELTAAGGATEVVWALHAYTVSTLERPDQLLVVDQNRTLRDYNLMNNDSIFVDVGAARTGVCVMSLSFWCAAWQLLPPVEPVSAEAAAAAATAAAAAAVQEETKPSPGAEPARELSALQQQTAGDADLAKALAAESTMPELSAAEQQSAVDAELAQALAAESDFASGSTVKYADRPERRLVTPLQLLSNRYTSGYDAAEHASVDQLPELEVAVDSTLGELRAQVLQLPAFRALLREAFDEADLPKYTLRLWLKTRLLRGHTPTLRSLRVKDSDSLMVQMVPVGTPDTLDVDVDANDVKPLDDKKPEVHEAPTIFDAPVLASAGAGAPRPPPPPKTKRYQPLLLIVYRRDSANHTFHPTPIEVTFRGKGVGTLCDLIADALQAVEPGVQGEQLRLAKFLTATSSFTPLNDGEVPAAAAAAVDTDTKQVGKKTKPGDRVRAQPYHMRDGDIVVVYRAGSLRHDDFFVESRDGNRGHKRRAGGDRPIEIFNRERNRRDDGAALQFDIDFGDT